MQQLDDRSPGKIAAVTLLGVFAVLWITYEVLLPISTDQGVFLWAGDVIRRGGVMYRDAWETRGPAPFYFTALIEIIFGHNAWGFRLVDVLIQAVGTAAVALTVRKAGGTRVSSLLAAALYILWYASLEYYNSAQPDGWVGVLLLLSVLALIYGRESRPGAFLVSGLLLGLCILNKPTYGLFVLIPAIYAARPPLTLRSWFRPVGLAAIGCLIPIIGAIIYFWHEGVLWTAYDVHIRYTALAYADLDGSWLPRISDTVLQLVGQPIAFALPFVVAGILLLWRRDKYLAATLTWWFVATLLNVIVQGKPWLYEWIPTFAPFAVLTGIGLGRLPDTLGRRADSEGRARDDQPFTIALAAVAVAIGIAAWQPVRKVAKWTVHVALSTSEAAYQSSEFSKEWGHQPGSMYAIARYVRERTSPHNGVVFYGPLAGGTFYANRPNPTRFGNVVGLVSGKDFGPRYRAEFMSAVERNPPKYVVAYDATVCGSTRRPTDSRCTENFPVFRTWLLSNYQLDSRQGDKEIWQYTGAGPVRGAGS